MATTTTTTNKPLNPRAQDLSPKGYNRAALFSGKALDFDGVNDILTLPTALTSSLSTTSVTFSTYIYPDFTTWSGDRDDAFTFGERGVILAFNSGNIYYYFRHESSGWDGLQVPNAAVTMQAWNHMVVTIDLGTDQYKAYVNGKLIASAGTARASIQYEGNALTIGAQAGARFFDGKVAGFKIFNTALTTAQVADLYLNPEKITPDGVATSALKLWLPMMEGAGASAYDGSGNGNDGTINGATWTAGVGSPVAQTALVSWNKGVNILKYSRAQFTAGSVENWNEGGGNPLTPLSVTGIDGQTNAAATYLNDQNSDADFAYYRAAPVVSGTQYKVTGWLKLGTATNAVVVLNNSVDWNTITGGNFVATAAAGYDQWKEFSITFTAPASTTINIHVGYHLETGVAAQTLGSFYMDAFSLRRVSDGDAYIKTNATAQTSAVLVPEGLTAGASIFGTDIITPRNAFALNLDGASWAQVGDNASTDMTATQTLECWINYSGTSASGASVLIGKWGLSGAWAYLMYINTNADKMYYTFSSTGSNALVNVVGSILVSNGWNHIVAVKSATDVKYYVNGALDSTHSSTDTIFNAATPVQIGRNENGSNYSPDQLANPRIYNRALTAAEVLRNYNADKAKFGL